MSRKKRETAGMISHDAGTSMVRSQGMDTARQMGLGERSFNSK